ncbi:MAG: hypothetical protein ABSD85_04790 [Acidimicrobiales bacterium]
MFDPLKLKPRPLWDEELPVRGDLHFAVGFGPKSALVSRIIAAGTASRTNHVGIITEVTQPDPQEPAEWKIVEALAGGVVEDLHKRPPNSTVIRVSDDPEVREALAAEAEEKAKGPPHIAYDWWAIGRILFVGLMGRVPFLTFPILAGPPLARYVSPAWLSFVITVAGILVLYRARGLLFRLAMKCPWPAPSMKNHAICSAFAREVIQDVFTPAALPGLSSEDVAITSPGDLFQELLHRCDYWTAVPHRQAVVDQPQPRRSR